MNSLSRPRFTDLTPELTEDLQAQAGGDPPSLSYVYTEIYQTIQRSAQDGFRQFRSSHSLADPSEIADEVYMRVARSRGRVFDDRKDLAWPAHELFYNSMIDRIRQSAFETRGSWVEVGSEILDEMISLGDIDREQYLSMDKGFEKLAEEGKLRTIQVLVYCSIYRYSIETTADLLSVSEDEITSDLAKAKEWLAQLPS